MRISKSAPSPARTRLTTSSSGSASPVSRSPDARDPPVLMPLPFTPLQYRVREAPEGFRKDSSAGGHQEHPSRLCPCGGSDESKRRTELGVVGASGRPGSGALPGRPGQVLQHPGRLGHVLESPGGALPAREPAGFHAGRRRGRDGGRPLDPGGQTRIGGYLAMGWLLAIAVNLVTTGMFYDLAVRDVEIAIAAYALARLTEARKPTV